MKVLVWLLVVLVGAGVWWWFEQGRYANAVGMLVDAGVDRAAAERMIAEERALPACDKEAARLADMLDERGARLDMQIRHSVLYGPTEKLMEEMMDNVEAGFTAVKRFDRKCPGRLPPGVLDELHRLHAGLVLP